MFKVFGGVILGVFVGGIVFEILHRRAPNLLSDIQNKAQRTVRSAADAFDEGYRQKEGA